MTPLSKGLKQVFDCYLYPVERLAKEGLPALESHYDQLSRRLGFRVPVPEDDLKRLGFLLLEDGKSADLKAVARALEQVHASGGFEHVLLVVARFRANGPDEGALPPAQPVLQRWTPHIAEWPKIVEAAKAGNSGNSR